jgi:hypothetical protein
MEHQPKVMDRGGKVEKKYVGVGIRNLSFLDLMMAQYASGI